VSCSIIGHDLICFQYVHITDRSLRFLKVPEDIYVPYDFSSGLDMLDACHIIVDKLGLSADDKVSVTDWLA